MTAHFRLRFDIKGTHVHCTLWVSPGAYTSTYALCGCFVVRRGEEFRDLVVAMQGVEVIGNDPQEGIEEAIIDLSDIPEAGPDWFARARFRPAPSEGDAGAL